MDTESRGASSVVTIPPSSVGPLGGEEGGSSIVNGSAAVHTSGTSTVPALDSDDTVEVVAGDTAGGEAAAEDILLKRPSRSSSSSSGKKKGRGVGKSLSAAALLATVLWLLLAVRIRTKVSMLRRGKVPSLQQQQQQHQQLEQQELEEMEEFQRQLEEVEHALERELQQPTLPSGEEEQQQQQQQQQDHLQRYMKRIEYLKSLHPLSIHLTELVGSSSAVSAYRVFAASLDRQEELQQRYIAEAAESPAAAAAAAARLRTPMGRSIEDSLCSLSILYEAARQHGVSLVRQLNNKLNINRVDREGGEEEEDSIYNIYWGFNRKELHALQESIGSSAADLLNYYVDGLSSSFSSLLRFAAAAEEALIHLPGMQQGIEGELLAAAAANVEFAVAATHAMNGLEDTAKDLHAVATDAAKAHAIREQEGMRRDCLDDLQQQQVTCRARRETLQQELEQEMQQQQPDKFLVQQQQQEIEDLKSIENVLERGQWLLQRHSSSIEEIREQQDIVQLHAAAQRAHALGRELRSLLLSSSSRLNSLPSFAAAAEAGEEGEEEETAAEADEYVQQQLQQRIQQLAKRHQDEAAATAKRVAIILSSLNINNFPVAPSFTAITREQQRQELAAAAAADAAAAAAGTDSPSRPFAALLIQNALQQVSRVQNALKQPLAAAAAAGEEDSSSSSSKKAAEKLLKEAKRAAFAADALNAEADNLQLRTRLLHALEYDMQLSASLAKRAAAAAGAAAGAAAASGADGTLQEQQQQQQQQQQLWHVQLEQKETDRLNHLLDIVSSSKEAAKEGRNLQDVAAAAANMKEAAVALTYLVQQQQPHKGPPNNNNNDEE